MMKATANTTWSPTDNTCLGPSRKVLSATMAICILFSDSFLDTATTHQILFDAVGLITSNQDEERGTILQFVDTNWQLC